MERVPGLFHLGLNASRSPSSQKLNYGSNVMHKLKRSIPGHFTNSAANNLLGVFLFYRKEIGEAVEAFKDVLASDSDNANATENLIFVFQRLQMPHMARMYEERKRTQSNKPKKVRAIQLAEQGFAYRFDCYLETDEMERVQKSIDLFNESLTLISDNSEGDSMIIIEIKSWLIQSLQKKFMASTRRGNKEGILSSYNQGITFLKEIIDSQTAMPNKMKVTEECIEKSQSDTLNVLDWVNPECGEHASHLDSSENALIKHSLEVKDTSSDLDAEVSPRYDRSLKNISCDCDGHMYWKVMAWTLLGVYLSKSPHNYWDERGKLVRVDTIPDIVTHCKYEEYFKNPEACFIKARSSMDEIHCSKGYHNINTESLIKYALFLRNREKCLEKAIGLLDQAISFDWQDGNWFSLMIRSQINEKRARMSLRTDSSKALARDLIVESIRDAMQAQKINSVANEFARIGEMYRLKAVEIDSPEECEISKLKASENFLYAVQSIGDERRPEIHRMHGNFFRCFGEDRQAIECFKRGIATDTADKETLSFNCLFETFLKMYKKQKEERCSGETFEDCINGSQVEDQKTGEEIKQIFQVKTEGRKESVTSPETGDQNVLHEMVYWFKFAFERYVKENDVQLDAKYCPRTTSDMKKIVEKFTTDHKNEMADIAAYFEVVLRKTKICEYIQRCSDDGEVWEKMFNDAKAKWMDKHPHAQKRKTSNLCSICENYIQSISRQNSAFPGSQIKARNVEYEYDFYVIYSPKDEDWVLYYLLTGLETTYGFKGAVSERDFHPGSKTLEEMNRIFDQSFKVVLILSENFNNDPLCAYGMCQAQTKYLQGNNKRGENYIIPVVKSTCAVPAQLSSLHTLDGATDLDWEKLAFSLESKM